MADAPTTSTLETPAPAAPAAMPAVQPMPAAEPAPIPEPISAVDRLRAFEDEKLGADTPRQQGAIERGVGSHFSRMSDADKAMHGKLEKLVDAEVKLSSAHSALIAADVEHDKALAAVEAHDG